MKTIILQLLVILSFCEVLGSQEALITKLELERENPEITFSKDRLALELLVMTSEEIVSIDSSSTEILSFVDDQGNDQLRRHEDAVAEFRQFQQEELEKGNYVSDSRPKGMINFDRIKIMNDNTSSFILPIESWALPASEACKLNLSVSVGIKRSSEEPASEVLVEDIIFDEVETLSLGQQEIPMFYSGYLVNEKQEKLKIYMLETYFLYGTIKSISFRNEQGKYEPVEFFHIDGTTEINLPEHLTTKPMDLQFMVTPLRLDIITIDQSISIGM